jgi:hypothetical protein
MALILKGGSLGFKDQENFSKMQPLVDNYWGGDNLEKLFPLPLWKMKQLFNSFPSSEVALKVTDIFFPTLVDAEWVVFDEDLETTLSDPNVQPNNYYFVFSDSEFEELQKNALGINKRLLLITGRLGKEVSQESQETSYCAFICASTLTISTPQGGTDGASTGYKIPPPR